MGEIKKPSHITPDKMSSARYFTQIAKNFSGGSVGNYLRLIPPSLPILGHDLGVQIRDAVSTRKKRRFPEYRASHTLGMLNYPWSKITGESMGQHPAGFDAASAFMTLVYGLDDVFDNGLIHPKNYRNSVDYLKDNIRLLQIGEINGYDMLGAVLTTIAYDFPPRGNRKQELVGEITSYLRDYAETIFDASKKESWTFEEALSMRQRNSGDFGKLLGEIFSYSIDKGHNPDSATVMWCSGMLGQFQDDLWDIKDDNTPKTHNLFMLLAREKFPNEAESLGAYLDGYHDPLGRIPPADHVIAHAPQTYEAYLKILADLLTEATYGSSNPKLRKFISRQFRTFTDMYHIVRVNPDRNTGFLVVSERIDHNARRRPPKYPAQQSSEE